MGRCEQVCRSIAAALARRPGPAARWRTRQRAGPPLFREGARRLVPAAGTDWPNRFAQPNERSTTPPLGNSTTPCFAWDHCSLAACADACPVAPWSTKPTVHQADPHAAAPATAGRLRGRLLHRVCQRGHQRARSCSLLLLVGGCDQQGQQVSQPVYGQVGLAALRLSCHRLSCHRRSQLSPLGPSPPL